MSEAEEPQQQQPEQPEQPELSAEPQPEEARPEEALQRPEEGAAARCPELGDVSLETTLEDFRMRKFFVLRPGTLNQAIKDVRALVSEEVDGGARSIWLMAEVDHWNNEKERLVILTDNSLLIFRYDFIIFRCDQIQRIPLNYVDRICHGPFGFPKPSLLAREGEGVRVFWDRLREPSFTSRWNPFATDFPFITFTHHPVRSISDRFAALCDIHKFREQLWAAAQKGHVLKPVPGKANGVLVLNQPVLIETYVGAMSFLGNQNKLGYSMARGSFGI